MAAIIPVPIKQFNPNYLVHIFGKDELGSTVDVWGALPEEFSLETTAQWEPVLEGLFQRMQGSLLGTLAEGTRTAAQLMGYSLLNRYTSQMVWTTTAPMEFRIPLKLDAVYDPRTEVTATVMQLLGLTLPSESITGSGAWDDKVPMHAPGPNFSPNSTYDIAMRLGNILLFPKIIVKSANVTFTVKPVKNGDFISADVDLTITTTSIYTKGDLRKAFLGLGS